MKKVLIVSLILVGAILLYLGNPEASSWFPKCQFYVLTGYECPACGTQRALHNLLHMDFASAFTYNPFLLISFPYLLALVFVQWFDDEKRFIKLREFCHNTRTVRIYLFLIVVWWVGRNII